MVGRRKTNARQKDAKAFFKKLTKRYPDVPAPMPRDRKVLEHLVFAAFLANAPFARARDSFVELQRYFIDWNEIRVSKASEIAQATNPAVDSVRVCERLRRTLQWIFDKTYQFELEDFRAKGRGEVIAFLNGVPYCTPFMRSCAVFFAFGGAEIPLDETSMRPLRLLGFVEATDDGREVVPCLEGAFDDEEARFFFFALRELGLELRDEATKKNAKKFLVSIDPAAAKRSAEPLVESTVPTDPREIARLYDRKPVRSRGGFSKSKALAESEIAGDFDEEKPNDFGDSPEFAEERIDSLSSSGPSEEAFITRNSASYVANETPRKKRVERKKESKAVELIDDKTKTTTKVPAQVSKASKKSKVEVSNEVSDVRKTLRVRVKEEGASKDVSSKKRSRVVKESNETLAKVVVEEKSNKPVASRVKKTATKNTVEKVAPRTNPKKSKGDVKKSRSAVLVVDKGSPKKSETVKRTVKKTLFDEPTKPKAKTIVNRKVAEKTISKKVETVSKRAKAKKDETSDSSRSTKKKAIPATKKGVVATALKGVAKVVKTATRKRKPSSEPPNSTGADVGKKTEKSSSKSKSRKA